MSEFMDRRKEQIDRQNREAESRMSIVSGGDGPHNPDMEARMTAVEVDVREIRGILQRLEPLLGRLDERTRKIEADTLPKLGTDLAELKGRVSQLPTALAIFAYMGSLVALVLGITGAVLGVSKYLGH